MLFIFSSFMFNFNLFIYPFILFYSILIYKIHHFDYVHQSLSIYLLPVMINVKIQTRSLYYS